MYVTESWYAEKPALGRIERNPRLQESSEHFFVDTFDVTEIKSELNVFGRAKKLFAPPPPPPSKDLVSRRSRPDGLSRSSHDGNDRLLPFITPHRICILSLNLRRTTQRKFFYAATHSRYSRLRKYTVNFPANFPRTSLTLRRSVRQTRVSREKR